jgi:hypothetical protein
VLENNPLYRECGNAITPDILEQPLCVRIQSLNIGQYHFAAGPGGAFSYLAWRGKTEISSRIPDTHYCSSKFTDEYAMMQQVSKKLAIGVKTNRHDVFRVTIEPLPQLRQRWPITLFCGAAE